MTAVLSAQSLSFAYLGRAVFSNWSMSFGPGLTWLQGPNGQGKSTLLKLLGGALTPSAGQLQVAGIGVRAQPLAYRREVFWCGPGELPFGHLRAVEYFGFLQGLYPRFDASQLKTHLQGLGLVPHLGTLIGAMSTGTQRKVWLAAALVVGTRAVLLDEPLNALDPDSVAYARRELAAQALGSGQAWLVTSHEAPCELDARARVVQLV